MKGSLFVISSRNYIDCKINIIDLTVLPPRKRVPKRPRCEIRIAGRAWQLEMNVGGGCGERMERGRRC